MSMMKRMQEIRRKAMKAKAERNDRKTGKNFLRRGE